jgi:DNA-binding beta-propeller fold protein YncE
MKKIVFLSMMILAIATFEGAQAQKPFRIINTFHIQSGGGWDYIAVGPGNNRLYVSHGTQVNILDETTGDSIGVIENTTGVHGIAFDKEHGKGFTSNGRINSVTVFDLTTNKVMAQIVGAGQNPDAILYDPFSKKIITCNGRGKNLSIIDPVENRLLDSIDVGGKPETAVSDGAGKLFVNIEDKSEIVQVDLNKRTVVARWPLAPAEEPSGLAFDNKTHRLFAGCSNKLLAVVDALSGKLVATVPIGDGCDGVAFDLTTKNIYSSNGEGTLSVLNETSVDKIEPVTTFATKRGARTITVDQGTHLIFLPTADFEPQSNPPQGRPKMIPGTFQVLVVGQ